MTANEEIRDKSIQHMVWLERYKSSQVRKIISLLNAADDDLAAQIATRLIRIEERGFDLGPATTARLDALRKEIIDSRSEIFASIYITNRDELFDFADYEAEFQAKMLESAALGASADIEIKLNRPARSLLKAAATSQPFQGRILREWYRDLGETSGKRITDAIRLGVTEGQTTDQIVRRIRGTRSKNYADGLLEIDRRNAQAIVRTATAHIADRAKNSVWQENADIIKGLKWIATLDGRTSPICRARDGKVYAVGKAPPVPAHWNCRSSVVAYLGEFETKGTRASMFGPVPEDEDYAEFFGRQPKAFQEEVLGVKKAKLYRQGGLSIDKFSDKTGREYTLVELKQRDETAWNKAFN